jgi:sulfate permease, SulP family
MNIPNKIQQISMKRYLPFLDWLPRYRQEDLFGDLLAGVIVAIMLVPQGMAYAMLAGLPPQVGLYASILPAILYGLLGSSRTLAVGPVALTSLLVAATVGPLAAQNSSQYLMLVLALALLVGIIQLLMGLLRLGTLVNFISHPVLIGFTSAAALIIAFSQLKHLFGLAMPRLEHLHEITLFLLQHLQETNLYTLGIGLGSVAVLIFFKKGLPEMLARRNVPQAWILPLSRSGPLVVVLAGTLLVWGLGLHDWAGVQVVGKIPAGLPALTLPPFDLALLGELLPSALTLSLIAFLESISVAKSLASKRREKVDANQELVALGIANLGAAFSGGYPVAGGFARSVVNFSVGARSGLASIITAILIALTLVFLMPLFFFLPQAVLAAIIIVAVVKLIDLATMRHVWRFSTADGFSMAVTFLAVLVVGIERGILLGVAAALVLYLWRTSRPHIALVGRIAESEHYRNVLRYPVETCPQTLSVRVDESLYFANAQYLESSLLEAVADHPQVNKLVLVCSAINFIDASALETLENLRRELKDAQVDFYLAEIKGPVMDRLQRDGFLERLGGERVFLSTHQAMQALGCEA